MYVHKLQNLVANRFSLKEWAVRSIVLLTKSYQLHLPEHVGMYAGSLLSHSDWLAERPN
jgi:hypothetical protein